LLKSIGEVNPAMRKHRRVAAGAVRAVLLLGAVAAVFVAGCEKEIHEARAPKPAGETKPALKTSTAQSADASATTAGAVLPANVNAAPVAETKPTLVEMMIGEEVLTFPPTKLIIHTPEAGSKTISVELYSDLPKSALRDYEGNELYLEMKLDAAAAPEKGETAARLEGATWRFKSSSSGKSSSPNGIFLHGQSQHLQPFDVFVKFARVPDAAGKGPDQLHAQIMGQFRAYQANTPEALAPFMPVRGSLPVEIEKKG
jgi:hypothetical protein